MYLFITVHSMEGAENQVVDTDKHNQVSSVIVISLSGFTYVKTKSLCICLSHFLIYFSYLIFSVLKIMHCKMCWLHD